MKKNMILIDNNLSFLGYIMEKSDYYVSVLITDESFFETVKERYSARISEIYTVKDIDRQFSYEGLDYDDIESYKGIQLRVENALRRNFSDINQIKDQYYKGLAFWIRVFKKYDINLVLSSSTNHNLLYDGICIPMAISKGIKAYTLDPIAYQRFYLCDRGRRLPVAISTTKKADSIRSMLTSEDNVLDVFNLDFDDKYNHMGLISVIYKIFGFQGLDFLRSFFTGTLNKKVQISAPSLESTYFERSRGLRHLRKNSRVLRKLERDPDFNENYVFYPLQFEPEGDNNNLTFDSQLMQIKMLSEVLPSGWKIYVKEHPHQFRLNTHLYYYYVAHIDNFKSKWFYNEIAKIENVCIVKRDSPSKELILHSKAVASRLGTALLEAVENEVPVLLLERCHPLSQCGDVLNCFSYEQIKRNIEKLANGYNPEYRDVLDELNQYISAKPTDVLDSIL